MSRFESSMHREWLAVTLLTVLGAGLRFWGFGALGLNHFDEGIYALSGLWSLSPSGLAGLDPIVIAYAPLDSRSWSDSATWCLGSPISRRSWPRPSVGWQPSRLRPGSVVGRSAWGRSCGSGAGGACDAHIAFSRKAPTDVPFGLAWLIAIGLGGRFLEKPTYLRPCAGTRCGVRPAVQIQWMADGRDRRPRGVCGFGLSLRSAALVVVHEVASVGLRFPPLSLLAAGVALLSYWPWYRFVENHGGYLALVAHHRSYLGGAARWLPYWKQQQAQLAPLGRPRSERVHVVGGLARQRLVARGSAGG